MNKPVSKSTSIARARHEAAVTGQSVSRQYPERDDLDPARGENEPFFPFRLQLLTTAQVQEKVNKLFACGHAHRFKVNLDQHAIIGSQLAMDCMIR